MWWRPNKAYRWFVTFAVCVTSNCYAGHFGVLKKHRIIKVKKIIGQGSNLHDYNMKHYVIGDTNVTADKFL